MKQFYIFITLICFSPLWAFPQCRLDIEIAGIKSVKGNIMLQVLNGEEKIIEQRIIPVNGNKCITSINNLMPGKYAVRYYHDENLNGKMDTNILGKPIEGYGFSNNAAGKFGPPTIDKCLFELVDQKKIILDITY